MEINNNRNTLTIHINKTRFKPVFKLLKRILKTEGIIIAVVFVGLVIGYLSNLIYNIN